MFFNFVQDDIKPEFCNAKLEIWSYIIIRPDQKLNNFIN